VNDQKLKSQMTSGMIWKFAERFAAQGVSFVVSMVLARILMPEDYGAVAIINIFISIADVFLSSGLNTSLIQKRDADDLDFSTIFYLNLGLSLALYLVLFGTAPFIAQAYDMPILKSTIRVFALRIPVSAFQVIQVAYISKKMQFKKFFFATITGTILSAVVGIAMAIKGMGVWALIGQYLTNTVIDTMMLWATVKWIPKKMFSIKAAVPLIKYSWKVMMTDLLGTLCNNLGDFIIGAKYNSANLAYYTKGKQLPQLFRTNIYTTLISVLFPGIAAVNDNMITVKKITRKSVRIMAYIVFPISLGLMAAGDTIIEVLFTEKWLPMLPYVYVMCVETIISVPATIALQPIKAVGRSDLMLKSEIIKKIFFMISTVVAMNYGVFAIALTVPANTLLDLTINTIINKKIINYSIFEELSDCFTAFTLSLMMAAIVVFIGKIELNIYVKVVIQILTGVLSYAGVSYLTKNKEFIYILNVGIKHFKNV
jgi:flippase wzx